MKYYYLFTGVLSLLLASCSMSEMSFPEDETSNIPAVFHATIDNKPDGLETKVYSDGNLHILWNADDLITIFPQVTYGYEYRFLGDDGANSGDFEKVTGETGNYSTGNTLDSHYAVYPYQENTTIDNNGVISFYLPCVQAYRLNSFGVGANTMVAKTPDTFLKFKNVGGYLSLKLYGTNVAVSSITLEGIDGEPLAGLCTIDMSSGVPVVTMDSDPDNVSKQLRIDCSEEPVELGTLEEPTEFCFVIPPVVFTDGFKITVKTPDGGVFKQSASISNFEIKRNTIESMNPLEVKNLVYPGSDIKLNGISSNAGGYGVSVRDHKTNEIIYNEASYDESTRTFSIVLPTVTDFSKVKFNYDLYEGDKLMVGGKVIDDETVIDASNPVALMVCRGDAEMKYTLVAKNTGLPVVKITTEDYFTLQQLESYKNSIQSSDNIDHRIWLPEGDKVFVKCRIEDYDGSAGMRQIKKDGSEVPVYEVDMKIKGRGNYTWKWDKKPYAMKFDSKREVLGMPVHKRWILLANWRDRTLLRNDAAFWLSKKTVQPNVTTGLPYTTRGQFVELEFNGEHRGNYYLCEQIKIDENRVNITEIDYGEAGLQNTDEHTGGYLMEIDSYFDEVNKFKSAEFNLNYMFKEPDEDELTKTDSLYMSGYINAFEKVLKTKSAVANKQYEDYLDVDSAIWFVLVNELTGNRDFFQGYPNYGPHSTYLYKDEGGKLFMGPIWDFDYETFIAQSYINQNSNNRDGWRGFTRKEYYYYYLCANQDFVDRVKTLWNLKKEEFLGLTDYIDEMVLKIGLSQKFDQGIWPFHSEENRNDNHDFTLGYEEAINLMKENFEARVTWMDNKISSLSKTNPSFSYQ